MTITKSSCAIIEEVTNGEIDEYGCLPSSPSSCVPPPTSSPTSSPNSAPGDSNTNMFDTVKEYHTDFTNNINQKYHLSGSHKVTERQLVYIYGATLIFIAFLVKICFCERPSTSKTDINAQLISNETGVTV